MQIAQNKYATLVKRKEWMAETTQDVQLLMAQQAAMQENVQLLESQLKLAKKRISAGNKQKDQANAKGSKDGKKSGRKLTNNERFVYVKDRKPPEWLKKNEYSGSGDKRWWNGSRYRWNAESSKWNKDDNAKVPKWYTRQQDNTPKGKAKRPPGAKVQPLKKKAKVPVSAFNAVRDSMAEETGPESKDGSESDNG